ncbi:response regulator [Mesorhizobium ventifaucium]|uniref:Response regulator receiver n=1 Tax=Mesorhizobium ventifaucium TaxID=666020 RepID=A0ABM9DFY2_9HYPH|nr:response regulator [Mesorhizobium ventifaucium]CAH2395317.1 Response regulator receiver [Mesorhizobium ventifaucium]
MTDPLRILVVEDEWLIAEDIAACLRASGHEVIGPAPSVAVALRLIGENPVDVALLDVQLYGETSLAIAEELQARRIPFACLSGFGPRDVPSALANSRFVRKPADQAAILSALAELVPTS